MYVGGSASFAYAGGGTVEEEVEGFKRIVEVVMSQINKEDWQANINLLGFIEFWSIKEYYDDDQESPNLSNLNFRP